MEHYNTITKVITPVNHKGQRQYSEPITTRRNFMTLMQSAGKCVRGSRDWFRFHFGKEGSAVDAKTIAFQHSNETYVYNKKDLTGKNTVEKKLVKKN